MYHIISWYTILPLREASLGPLPGANSSLFRGHQLVTRFARGSAQYIYIYIYIYVYIYIYMRMCIYIYIYMCQCKPDLVTFTLIHTPIRACLMGVFPVTSYFFAHCSRQTFQPAAQVTTTLSSIACSEEELPNLCNIYIYICIYTCICICIEREGESIHIYIYIYIYIYIQCSLLQDVMTCASSCACTVLAWRVASSQGKGTQPLLRSA